MGSRYIALLFLQPRRQMGWVVNATPRPLYSRERPGTHCIGGQEGHRAGLDGCGKSRPHRDSIPGPSSSQRVAIPTELQLPPYVSKVCLCKQTARNWFHFVSLLYREDGLTLNLLTWTKWWAPASASKWRMGFNSAFKGLKTFLIFQKCSRATGCSRSAGCVACSPPPALRRAVHSTAQHFTPSTIISLHPSTALRQLSQYSDKGID